MSVSKTKGRKPFHTDDTPPLTGQVMTPCAPIGHTPSAPRGDWMAVATWWCGQGARSSGCVTLLSWSRNFTHGGNETVRPEN